MRKCVKNFIFILFIDKAKVVYICAYMTYRQSRNDYVNSEYKSELQWNNMNVTCAVFLLASSIIGIKLYTNITNSTIAV